MNFFNVQRKRNYFKAIAIETLEDSTEVPANKRIFIKLIKQAPNMLFIQVIMLSIGYKRIKYRFVKRGLNRKI